MKKFSTLIEAAEYIHGLDCSVRTKKWLIRECAKLSLTNPEIEYSVHELEYGVDVYTWSYPASAVDPNSVEKIVNGVNSCSGKMGITCQHDVRESEVIFFICGEINLDNFIQFGAGLKMITS